MGKYYAFAPLLAGLCLTLTIDSAAAARSKDPADLTGRYSGAQLQELVNKGHISQIVLPESAQAGNYQVADWIPKMLLDDRKENKVLVTPNGDEYYSDCGLVYCDLVPLPPRAPAVTPRRTAPLTCEELENGLSFCSGGDGPPMSIL